MKLTVITPVFRTEYLDIISKTIPSDVDWICVYDDKEIKLPVNAKGILIDKVQSSWGVFKVNVALNEIKDGHIYVLDDDTILHPDFSILLHLDNRFDFIYFNQCWKNGKKRVGGIVKEREIDIGNYIVSRELIGNTFLKEGEIPDGTWAVELYKKCKKPLYLNKFFSIYNYLR